MQIQHIVSTDIEHIKPLFSVASYWFSIFKNEARLLYGAVHQGSLNLNIRA